jgi:hypothetical protein
MPHNHEWQARIKAAQREHLVTQQVPSPDEAHALCGVKTESPPF